MSKNFPGGIFAAVKCVSRGVEALGWGKRIRFGQSKPVDGHGDSETAIRIAV
jgi:hypothetical protein